MGVVVPVSLKSVLGRDGLGSGSSLYKIFRKKITTIIEEYIASHSPYDLVFTTGFDKEQRKVIHDVARRFDLKSKSFGKGDDRHMTLSRKFDPKSLMMELLRRGGESEKYMLLPPASSTNNSHNKF